MRHVVHTETYKALAAAGISIPFPQRDLNIVSQGLPPEIHTTAPTKPAQTKRVQAKKKPLKPKT